MAHTMSRVSKDKDLEKNDKSRKASNATKVIPANMQKVFGSPYTLLNDMRIEAANKGMRYRFRPLSYGDEESLLEKLNAITQRNEKSSIVILATWLSLVTFYKFKSSQNYKKLTDSKKSGHSHAEIEQLTANIEKMSKFNIIPKSMLNTENLFIELGIAMFLIQDFKKILFNTTFNILLKHFDNYAVEAAESDEGSQSIPSIVNIINDFIKKVSIMPRQTKEEMVEFTNFVSRKYDVPVTATHFENTILPSCLLRIAELTMNKALSQNLADYDIELYTKVCLKDINNKRKRAKRNSPCCGQGNLSMLIPAIQYYLRYMIAPHQVELKRKEIENSLTVSYCNQAIQILEKINDLIEKKKRDVEEKRSQLQNGTKATVNNQHKTGTFIQDQLFYENKNYDVLKLPNNDILYNMDTVIERNGDDEFIVSKYMNCLFDVHACNNKHLYDLNWFESILLLPHLVAMPIVTMSGKELNNFVQNIPSEFKLIVVAERFRKVRVIKFYQSRPLSSARRHKIHQDDQKLPKQNILSNQASDNDDGSLSDTNTDISITVKKNIQLNTAHGIKRKNPSYLAENPQNKRIKSANVDDQSANNQRLPNVDDTESLANGNDIMNC